MFSLVFFHKFLSASILLFLRLIIKIFLLRTIPYHSIPFCTWLFLILVSIATSCWNYFWVPSIFYVPFINSSVFCLLMIFSLDNSLFPLWISHWEFLVSFFYLFFISSCFLHNKKFLIISSTILIWIFWLLLRILKYVWVYLGIFGYLRVSSGIFRYVRVCFSS